MDESASHPARPDGEAALLAGLRAGDESVFEEVVRRFGPRMLATARRLLRNEEDARDAVQEAFLAAFKGIGGFDGRARLSTWLHRIGVNAALMRLRRKRQQPELSLSDLLPRFQDDGHHAEPVAPWDGAAERVLEQKETRAQIRAAIDSLPDDYRTILLVRDIEGLDTAEAARQLGVSEGVVRTRLHRARQALRTLLDPHFRGDGA